MDLILRGTDGTDLCVLDVDSLDLAYGTGANAENDLELTLTGGAAPMLECGQLVYAEGSEYGGMVTRVASDDGLTWRGLTWSGLLACKVLVPDGGVGTLSVSGDANDVLRQLVARVGLADVFEVPASKAGIEVRHTFEAYQDAWSGVCDMLRASSARPSMAWEGEAVRLAAVPATDWAAMDEFDSDLVDVSIDLDYLPTNHLVGRGEGSDGERVAVDLYMDLAGNVSERQTLKGRFERAEYYDYGSADRDKLVADGTKRLKGYWQAASTVTVSLSDTVDRYGLGDVIGGTDARTGVSAQATISKKVVKVDARGRLTVQYGTEAATTSGGVGGGSSAQQGGATYYAGRGLTLTGRTFSAEVDASDLARAEGKADAAAKAASDLEQDSVGSVSGAYPVVATADGRAVTVSVSTVPAENVNAWFK